MNGRNGDNKKTRLRDETNFRGIRYKCMRTKKPNREQKKTRIHVKIQMEPATNNIRTWKQQ